MAEHKFKVGPITNALWDDFQKLVRTPPKTAAA